MHKSKVFHWFHAPWRSVVQFIPFGKKKIWKHCNRVEVLESRLKKEGGGGEGGKNQIYSLKKVNNYNMDTAHKPYDTYIMSGKMKLLYLNIRELCFQTEEQKAAGGDKQLSEKQSLF